MADAGAVLAARADSPGGCGDRPRRAADAIDEQGTVIIAGMGRFGQVVNRLRGGARAPDGGDRQPPGDGRADARARDQGLSTATSAGRSCSRRPASPRRRRWCWRSTTRRQTCGWRASSAAAIRTVPDHRPRPRPAPCLPAARRRGARTACARSSTARCGPASCALAALGHDRREIEAVAAEFVQPRPPDAGGARRALAPGRAERAERRLPRQGARAVRGDRGGAARRADARGRRGSRGRRPQGVGRRQIDGVAL